MKNSMGKLILTLTIIGIVSALTLAFVYQWTMPHIRRHQQAEQEKAIFKVLPEAEEIKEVNKNGQTFFEGFTESGTRIGVAKRARGPGFQGIIELMIGVDPESEKIYGISILTHEETPGLGAKIEGEEYKSNFTNKPFTDFSVVKREAEKPAEIEAIAGATISSRKVTAIVEKTLDDIKKVYGGGE